jgi:sucrose-phosphate synthase
VKNTCFPSRIEGVSAQRSHPSGGRRPLNIHLVSLHGLFTDGSPHLGCDPDNGGQIVYVMDLARALAAHPDVGQVTLVTRQIDDPRWGRAYARPVEQVTDTFAIRRVPFGGPGYLPKEQLWPHLPEATRAIRATFATPDARPDVVHGHYADAGRVSDNLAEAWDVPFLHTGHSLGRIKLERLLADGEDLGQAMAKFAFDLRFAAEEATLCKASFIVTSSSQEIGTYSGYEHAARARFEVLPPGVDRQRFHPLAGKQEHGDITALEQRLAPFLRDPSKRMVVVLCRADRKKNIGAVLKAFGSSPDLRRKANLVLCVGQREDLATKLPGERAVYEAILHEVDRFNLYGSVAYPKAHDPIRDVPALYRLAAQRGGVFVNVALTEPFGLTLLEAAASGLPVVATSDGGPSEMVPRLGNGLLVHPTDVAGIQAAVGSLIDDRALWETCATRGLANLPTHYSWPLHVQRYLSLLHPLLDGRDAWRGRPASRLTFRNPVTT